MNLGAQPMGGGVHLYNGGLKYRQKQPINNNGRFHRDMQD